MHIIIRKIKTIERIYEVNFMKRFLTHGLPIGIGLILAVIILSNLSAFHHKKENIDILCFQLQR